MSIKVNDEVTVTGQCPLEGATGIVKRIYGEAIGGGLNHGPLKTREYAIIAFPGYAGDRHIPTALLAVR